MEGSILVDLNALDFITDAHSMKLHQTRDEDRHLLEMYLYLGERALLVLLREDALDCMVESITLLRILPHLLREQDVVSFFVDSFAEVSVNVFGFEAGDFARSLQVPGAEFEKSCVCNLPRAFGFLLSI